MVYLSRAAAAAYHTKNRSVALFSQDPLVQYRDVLPVTYAFGTAGCWSGYEGIVSDDDRFMTCHYNIFEPSWVQRNSIPLIIG